MGGGGGGFFPLFGLGKYCFLWIGGWGGVHFLDWVGGYSSCFAVGGWVGGLGCVGFWFVDFFFLPAAIIYIFYVGMACVMHAAAGAD